MGGSYCSEVRHVGVSLVPLARSLGSWSAIGGFPTRRCAGLPCGSWIRLGVRFSSLLLGSPFPHRPTISPAEFALCCLTAPFSTPSVLRACIWGCRYRSQPTSLSEGRGRKKARGSEVRPWGAMAGSLMEGDIITAITTCHIDSQQSEFRAHSKICGVSLLPCAVRVILLSVCPLLHIPEETICTKYFLRQTVDTHVHGVEANSIAKRTSKAACAIQPDSTMVHLACEL